VLVKVSLGPPTRLQGRFVYAVIQLSMAPTKVEAMRCRPNIAGNLIPDVTVCAGVLRSPNTFHCFCSRLSSYALRRRKCLIHDGPVTCHSGLNSIWRTGCQEPRRGACFEDGEC